MENPEQNTLADLQAIPESATRQSRCALPEPAAIREPERAVAVGLAARRSSR